jgi:type IV pilus assembly protein PilO
MAKSFNQLAARTQLIIFGMLCVLAIAGAWQVSIGPDAAELETRRAHLANLEAEIVRVQAITDHLPELQREVKALEVSLRETTAAIPEEKDPQDVLRNLHDVAADSSLDIASFKPSPIVDKAQYSEWPIQLTFEGGFHDLGRFFDRLASMARLISVSDIDIKTKTKPNGRGSVTVSCLATTFVFRQEMATGPAGPAATPGPTGAKGTTGTTGATSAPHAAGTPGAPGGRP